MATWRCPVRRAPYLATTVTTVRTVPKRHEKPCPSLNQTKWQLTLLITLAVRPRRVQVSFEDEEPRPPSAVAPPDDANMFAMGQRALGVPVNSIASHECSSSSFNDSCNKACLWSSFQGPCSTLYPAMAAIQNPRGASPSMPAEHRPTPRGAGQPTQRSCTLPFATTSMQQPHQDLGPSQWTSVATPSIDLRTTRPPPRSCTRCANPQSLGCGWPADLCNIRVPPRRRTSTQ